MPMSWSASLVRGGVAYTYSRVLPVDVNTVKIMLLDEFSHVGRERHAVRWFRTLSEDSVRRWLSREAHPPKEIIFFGPGILFQTPNSYCE